MMLLGRSMEQSVRSVQLQCLHLPFNETLLKRAPCTLDLAVSSLCAAAQSVLRLVRCPLRALALARPEHDGDARGRGGRRRAAVQDERAPLRAARPQRLRRTRAALAPPKPDAVLAAAAALAARPSTKCGAREAAPRDHVRTRALRGDGRQVQAQPGAGGRDLPRGKLVCERARRRD
eukprot:5348752-Pleurochrysis_carterae.AAC.15